MGHRGGSATLMAKTHQKKIEGLPMMVVQATPNRPAKMWPLIFFFFFQFFFLKIFILLLLLLLFLFLYSAKC